MKFLKDIHNQELIYDIGTAILLPIVAISPIPNDYVFLILFIYYTAKLLLSKIEKVKTDLHIHQNNNYDVENADFTFTDKVKINTKAGD